jgi:uncharacterized protein YxjI
MQLPETVHIQQKVEGLEALTGIEVRNQYTIRDEEGGTLGYGAEEQGGFLTTIARLVYSQGRPLEITVTDEEGNKQLILSKGFHLLFPHFEVKDAKGNVVGKAKTRFNLLKKQIDVLDKEERHIFTAEASVFYIGKLGFKVLSNDEQKGTITKQWSGVGKELFTDADHFHVQFDAIEKQGWRKMLLALAFAIDIAFFEQE